MTIHEIIKRPLATEKYDRARDQHNQYAFEVDRKATKLDVKRAVEQLFKVKVTQVQTSILKGKTKRANMVISGQTSVRKRALVTLKQGDAISLFEGK